jgi:signal transduction histidine kinase/DNA-binding response OmpR family regulator
MLRFLHASIPRKLTWIIMVTSTIALVIAAVSFALNDFVATQQTMRRDLGMLAQIVGANCASTLSFAALGAGDEKPAAETLKSLAVKPHVEAAAVYNADGHLFARYVRSDLVGRFRFPGRPDEGYRGDARHMAVFQPIVLDSQRIGSVFVQSDLQEVDERLRSYARVVFLILLGSSLVALAISSRVQRVISGPILDLAGMARRVSVEKNYSLRASKQTEDEIGYLIDRFNEMLAQIETQDVELRQVNEELLESERAAMEANQAKSAFLASMSHELRTPLNAIIGYSEMLQEEVEDLEVQELSPDLQKIHSAGKHLLALINDILDLSKIEAGKMDLYLETFDLAEAIREVVTTVEPLVQKKANRLEVRCDPALGTMHADVTKIRQSLFNLLSNASKFTENGTITLEAERERAGVRDWIVLSVSDTGIGMTPEQQANLFQAFSQADASTTRKYGGTGLGLVITRRFCEMMGGTIVVRSEAGEGSTFTIRLPAHVAETCAAGEAAEPAADAGAEAAGADTVLVIDDDPRVHDMLRRFLGKEGFAVLCAENGWRGLELARAAKPAAITLDCMMPELDGWGVLAELKADPALAEIPVIMLTIVEERGLGFALGASDYLTKPVDRHRLLQILKRYRRHHASQPILIVEDDPLARQLLHQMLARDGWPVAEAGDGRAALRQLEQNPPALILLDLMLPEMDGFQFLEEMRRHEAWRQIPVVVVTARDLTAEDQRWLSGCVERVLQKGSYQREELLGHVRDLLAARARPAGVG